MPRRRPTSNGHDDTIPIPAGKGPGRWPGDNREQDLRWAAEYDTNLREPSKELVPIYRKGRDLDMAIFEREIARILNKMRVSGRRDEDTEPAILRAIATYEAAG